MDIENSQGRLEKLNKHIDKQLIKEGFDWAIQVVMKVIDEQIDLSATEDARVIKNLKDSIEKKLEVLEIVKDIEDAIEEELELLRRED